MQQLNLAAVLLLSMLILTSHASEAPTYNEQTFKETLRTYKDYRWFMYQLPTVLYNLCALYYVSPDCLDELFGEDFDITTIVEEICPM